MRIAVLLLFLLQPGLSMQIFPQNARELAELWEKDHVTNILPSNVRHKDLQNYLERLRKHDVKVAEVGRSYGGREIYQVEWGKGPLKIFLWSQMHGDEPTATSALIDIFSMLQKYRDKDWVKALESAVTIRAVPMLNPDGAELYIRRNLQGIDINRDALDLKTPEAQLLKKLRDEWSPQIGFNLHNQNALTTVGSTAQQAAISLLVVYGDAAKTSSEGHDRNKRVVSGMIDALNKFIPGHIARYDDGFTATAFGDNFSAWGTPVILIETGALYGQDEMFLVKMNFVAMMTAFKSIADGSEKTFSPANYDGLAPNSSGGLLSIIFRNATVVTPGAPPQTRTADVGLVRERRRAEFSAPAAIRSIGDLSSASGLEEFDASGFYLVGRFAPLTSGGMGEILFYKKDRQIDWTAADLEKQFPPDAVFSVGKWVKGAELFSRK